MRSSTGRGGGAAAPGRRRGDGLVIGALLLLMVLDGTFSGIYNQAFNVFPVWAEAHVERRVLGFLAPVTWFTTLDGVLTIVGTVVAVRVWGWQARRNPHPNDITRVAIGFVLLTGAFLILALGAVLGGAGKSPLWPEVGFFLFADFSIPWIDTVILAVVSKDAPPAITSTMLGVYYLAIAAGNFSTGWLGGASDRMSMPAFWLMHAAIAGAVLVFLIVAGRPLNRFLTHHQASA